MSEIEQEIQQWRDMIQQAANDTAKELNCAPAKISESVQPDGSLEIRLD